jgi:hypothetical protein
MKSRQRGITLMETLGALAISSLMLVGLTAMIDSAMEDSKGQQVALYHSQIVAAARKYITANYSELVVKTPTATTITAIDVPELVNKRFLPANFALTNAYGQSTCVLVRQPNAISPPPATPTGKERLDALVVTTGGQPIEEKNLPAVAASAGQASGFISKSATTIARGASFNLDTAPFRNTPCNSGGTAVLNGSQSDGGHLAAIIFNDGPGQLSTDFLYRNEIPGRPDLNTMNAGIRLADKAVVTEGSDCRVTKAGSATPAAVAAIAVDASNQLLRCGSDGKWSAVTTWKSPVDSFATLPLTDKRGDVRMTLDKSRAFMFNGTTWTALAVDQNGNFNVENDLTVGRNANIGQTLTTGHDVVAGNDVKAKNEVEAGRDILAGRDALVTRDIRGSNVFASNNVTANKEVRGVETVRGGYITADTIVQANELFLVAPHKPGETCHIPVIVNGKTEFILPIGTVVRDAKALLLVCADDKKLRYPNGTFTP